VKNIIRHFILYPVWTNVLFVGILVFGLIFLGNMKYAFFPEIPPDIISVNVTYPGASPEEIEEGVVIKVEENLDGIEGIERVTSASSENFAAVRVEVATGYDIDLVLDDVKNAIDRINSFPAGIERPVVFKQKFRDQALSIVLFGETDLYNLKYVADRFRDDLLATDEISQVDVSGFPEREISIEVKEEVLRQYGMSFDQIANAVRRTNINISGGKFDTKDEEILIRSYNRNYYTDDLREIVVRGSEGGQILFLKDVAAIKERWEDSPTRTYYEGKPAVVLSVKKTIAEDILEIREKSIEIIDAFNASDNGLEALVLDDRTIPLRQRLALLINNGLFGLMLVMMSLTLFMNLRLSMWVAVGIPFSFAGMFIIASMYGITLNVISLFGMIIVVGILVDDAIVVGENIYAHYERGKTAYQAALDGAVEVVPAVFTSVTTTIIAFLPFFFLDGFLGKFIWHMALVVIASLFFSLIEAFLVLPGHLAHSKGLHPHKDDKPLRRRIEKNIKHFTHNVYGPSLRWAMNNKWFTLMTPMIVTIIVIFGLFPGGFIRSTFFPFIDGDTIPINVTLTPGTQESKTKEILAGIRAYIPEVNAEYASQRSDSANVILSSRIDIGSNDFGETGSHTGKLTLQLMDGEERNLDSFILSNAFRRKVGQLAGVEKISFGRTSFFGKPVSVSLLGTNIESLKNARLMLKNELQNMTQLRDITDSDQEGLRELSITLKPRAKALGFTLQDVAGQVRQGYFGQEIQRLQRGRDEVKVWVRYSDVDRSRLSGIDDMRIRAANGKSYPFADLATYNIERGVILINHLDRQREIKVEADLVDPEDDIGNILSFIQSDILPQIAAANPGVRYSLEGQQRSQQKVADSAAMAFPPALIMIVILMILVFRSSLQAMLIFALIPLGIVGSVIGHGIQGIPVNILSVYGLIALSGIIVNDSIVFVDQINRNLRAGLPVFDSVYNAGIARLRPILLTTFTTVLGLGPLILETSRQAQFLIPMAVSVAYGLLFATFLILLVLPAGFLVLNRLRQFYNGDRSDGGRSVEPAVKELAAVAAIEGGEHA
jgi:multidrug efflux pump subunit AcrB